MFIARCKSSLKREHSNYFNNYSSGLVTEASDDWSIENIEPYVLVCLDVF